MPLLLAGLEFRGELTDREARFDGAIKVELLTMSAATIDRYLAPARRKTLLWGLSTTTPSPLVRSPVTIRKAGDEIEAIPGFFEVDTVAHRGPSLMQV